MAATRPIAVLVIAIALSSIRPHAQGVYDPEARLAELGLKLPPPGAPVATIQK